MSVIERLFRKAGFSLVHSQEGEDIILSRVFAGRKRGFYLDVGAHHPWRYSNTALLYSHGWEGVVVDPNLSARKWFRMLRPRDRFLGCAAGAEKGEASYARFAEAALNTIERGMVERRGNWGYVPRDHVTVPIRTLDDILEEHSEGRRLDLVSMDVEGHEEAVFEGFDLGRWRPEVVCVERVGARLGREDEDIVLRRLRQAGYGVFAKLLHSWVLVALESMIWSECEA